MEEAAIITLCPLFMSGSERLPPVPTDVMSDAVPDGTTTEFQDILDDPAGVLDGDIKAVESVSMVVPMVAAPVATEPSSPSPRHAFCLATALSTLPITLHRLPQGDRMRILAIHNRIVEVSSPELIKCPPSYIAQCGFRFYETYAVTPYLTNSSILSSICVSDESNAFIARNVRDPNPVSDIT